jgi:diphthamide synthase (EF-2-diphthine--ammonia ligase)
VKVFCSWSGGKESCLVCYKAIQEGHMEKNEVDVCGENGEYHTLVVDGPIFSRRIDISETRVTRRGMMAFLHVLSFALRQKS